MRTLLFFLLVAACGDDSAVTDSGTDTQVDATSDVSADAMDAASCEDTDSSEPNDTIASAGPVPDEAVPLILCPGGTDHYYFDAAEAVDIFIGADVGTVSADVYDSEDNLLESSSPGAPTSLTFTPPADGRYYVRITGCCADIIPYTIRITPTA